MLSKKNRLKKKKDFEKVFKKGRGFKEDFLFLKTAENGLENSRIGIVVGTKVAKKATERNLIKRRLREAVRKRISEIKPGLDIVIVALEGLDKKVSFQTIQEVLERLFLKAKIIETK